MQNWVKIPREDRLEYPSKRVDDPDGYHWTYEPDYSAEPKRYKVDPLIVEDNGDGTVTAYSYGVYGPVGVAGKPKVQPQPIKTKRDKEIAAREQLCYDRAMQSQQAQYIAMTALRDSRKVVAT